MSSLLNSKKIKELRQAMGIDENRLATTIDRTPEWVKFVETEDDPGHNHFICLEDIETLALAFQVQPHELIKNV